jgi:integrase
MIERAKLSAAAVARYKPRADRQRREIRDAGSNGLILLVHGTGSKSWIMRFRRPGGRLAKLTLGTVDASVGETHAAPVLGGHLSLAGARQLAAEVHRERKMGRDVVADRSVRKAAAREQVANTFGEAARVFIEKYAKARHRRWRETASMLGFLPGEAGDLSVVRGGLVARWGNRPIADITGRDVAQELVRVVDRGAPHAANTMLSYLRKMFNWLVERYVVEANPCAKVRPPTKAEARDRYLSDEEIKQLWAATDDASHEGVGEPWGALLRLLLVTGQRRDEVARMTWSEISDDGATWTLPKERAKNNTTHVVPLSPLAQEIIANVRTVTGRSDFVFTTTGDTPVSGFSKAKARLDGILKIPAWRIHDLRRTAATGMARLGQPVHVVERALNHKSGMIKGVAAVYNRYAYEAEVRTALTAWANLLREITSLSAVENVVQIRNIVTAS